MAGLPRLTHRRRRERAAIGEEVDFPATGCARELEDTEEGES